MKCMLPAAVAAVTLFAGASAQAATWQFDAFTLSDRSSISDPAVTVVSQSATQTVLTLDSLSARSSGYASIDNYQQPIEGAWGYPVEHVMMVDTEDYDISVRDGYKITGVTVDLVVKGDMRPGQPNGVTTNKFSFDINFGKEGDWTTWQGASLGGIENLNGTSGLNTSFDNLSLTGNFMLNASPYEWTGALAARRYSEIANMLFFVEESYSNVWADEIKLTFHTAAVSAVPEPGTYLMLGAGLALMGGMARRRRAGK